MLDSEFMTVQMPHSTFLAWLRNGICWLPLDEFTPAADDIFVQLSPKYSAILNCSQPITALIDEVVAVTQATPELTQELSIWLRNLGETWLPVKYFACGTVRPVATVPESAAPTQAEPDQSLETISTAPTAEPSLDALAQSDVEPMPTTQQASPKKKSQTRRTSARTKQTKLSATPEDDTNQTLLFGSPDTLMQK